jgi:hypothetical protein
MCPSVTGCENKGFVCPSQVQYELYLEEYISYEGRSTWGLHRKCQGCCECMRGPAVACLVVTAGLYGVQQCG